MNNSTPLIQLYLYNQDYLLNHVIFRKSNHH
nr:MAG TPA: hypothetical protein [Caudoviricetes sp.]